MKVKTRYKGFLLFVGAILFVTMLAGCGSQTDDETDKQDTSGKETPEGNNPIVTITMENDDEIMLELYPDIAPNTVDNFISLIQKDYYDGVIFHRVIPDFMIQGGDPAGNGTGGPGYTIKGEFSSNGFDNDLKHDRGVISMARTTAPDSAGSQFFIMVKNSPSLDEEYAAFGKVIEGMDAVDAIVSVERDASDKPLEDQQMKTLEVDMNGYDFSEPEVIE